MIWASQGDKSKYTFHYKAMKTYNGDKQMRSDWHIPICNGKERIKINGKKAHSTQKPEGLLYRIILANSNPDDIILDPFMGSGTTGAIAKLLGRNFIGIEKEASYVNIAKDRISEIKPINFELLNYKIEAKPPKVPFGSLIERDFIKVGEKIYSKNRKHSAIVLANASIEDNNGFVGSIHKVSANFLNKVSNNGWRYWFVIRDGGMVLIDGFRRLYENK